ncbi:conjugative transposon protein TraK [Mucilaginibacter sp. L3T2-6]|uniref:conjugative transposon protein TraK n=1 Tax=Mucilaginibacter sp. L3T2-6 TaxID=3062491 RepID=UPI002676AE90|nr:conjugative transposon protein TraK [Mucilaginibacter sp. L3T2-6]MDO3641515.1 conjugative transposon protein TraK [Mucilaginibacter sp. L3T2-6]MDV6213724.1 conjugative transposon protein TraK [Mucilaginibacter sp. L3T2-6]
MFQQLKNIDTAFKHIRLFSYLLILACITVSCFAIYKSYQSSDNYKNHIYILANGKALEAFAADRKDNIPVEIRDHVKMFHHYFFTLDPDDKQIQAGITQALYLADGSAKTAYDNLKEAGYYNNIVSGNISQQISVDSVQVDINQYPFYFKCFATEKLVRSTSTLSRSLVTQGYLRNVSRSDNNPHGFLIEKWETTENRDLTTQSK